MLFHLENSWSCFPCSSVIQKKVITRQSYLANLCNCIERNKVINRLSINDLTKLKAYLRNWLSEWHQPEKRCNLIQTALSWLRRQWRLNWEPPPPTDSVCIIASGRTELQGVVTTGQTPPPHPRASPPFGRALCLLSPRKNKPKNILKELQTHWGRRLLDAQPPGGRFRVVKARNTTVWKEDKQLPPSSSNHDKCPLITFLTITGSSCAVVARSFLITLEKSCLYGTLEEKHLCICIYVYIYNNTYNWWWQ